MSLEELKTYQDELKAKGKNEGNSKEAAKVASLIKVAQAKAGTKAYSDQELADAATLLSRGVTNPSGWTAQNADFIQSATGNAPDLTTGAPVGQLGVDPTTTGALTPTAGITGDIASLEKQLADKQKALTDAMTNINDNPWYSEATRTGKLAKLNDVAQVDIQNLQNQINAKNAEKQQAFNNNITTQQLALQQQQANKPNTASSIQTDASGNMYAVTIDTTTGAVINKQSLGITTKVSGSGSGSSSDAKQEAAFNSAISSGIDQLKSGEDWGTVWNRIYSMFRGVIPDAVLQQLIDQGLGTSWREAGAYENYIAKKG